MKHLNKTFVFVVLMTFSNFISAAQFASKTEPNAVKNTVGIPNINGTPIFFEDFEGQNIPNDWAVIDVDGNIVDPKSAAVFTAAWVNYELGSNNFTAASTSYYEPAGTSDDWLITPQVNVESSSTLSWLAVTFSADFPDGYEVYVSTTTQDVTGCSTNPPVLTRTPGQVAADILTEETVDLSAAGYANESIYVCFRNNTFNGTALFLDDVMVTGLFLDDLIFYDGFESEINTEQEKRPHRYLSL